MVLNINVRDGSNTSINIQHFIEQITDEYPIRASGRLHGLAYILVLSARIVLRTFACRKRLVFTYGSSKSTCVWGRLPVTYWSTSRVALTPYSSALYQVKFGSTPLPPSTTTHTILFTPPNTLIHCHPHPLHFFYFYYVNVVFSSFFYSFKFRSTFLVTNVVLRQGIGPVKFTELLLLNLLS